MLTHCKDDNEVWDNFCRIELKFLSEFSIMLYCKRMGTGMFFVDGKRYKNRTAGIAQKCGSGRLVYFSDYF